jgi:YHS domain-containing protein
MGGKIDKKHFVDVKGYRFYLCCPGCGEKIRKNPGKYIEILAAKGQAPAKLCKGCKKVKGSKECCPRKKKRWSWW